jgi:hypothetical protein
MEEGKMSLSTEELAREGAELLPDKEVLSILDLFVNLDIGLDLAAPIDLAVAANANVAAAVNASATANVLTIGSDAFALASQGTMITQYISGEAIAYAPQDASISQGSDVFNGDGGGGGDPTGGDSTQVTTEGLQALLSGPLLKVEIDAAIDANLAAPVAGAVAANANVAAPINASVAANVLTIDSSSTALAAQTAIIEQTLDDVTASATAEQTADIEQ